MSSRLSSGEETEEITASGFLLADSNAHQKALWWYMVHNELAICERMTYHLSVAAQYLNTPVDSLTLFKNARHANQLGRRVYSEIIAAAVGSHDESELGVARDAEHKLLDLQNKDIYYRTFARRYEGLGLKYAIMDFAECIRILCEHINEPSSNPLVFEEADFRGDHSSIDSTGSTTPRNSSLSRGRNQVLPVVPLQRSQSQTVEAGLCGRGRGRGRGENGRSALLGPASSATHGDSSVKQGKKPRRSVSASATIRDTEKLETGKLVVSRKKQSTQSSSGESTERVHGPKTMGKNRKKKNKEKTKEWEKVVVGEGESMFHDEFGATSSNDSDGNNMTGPVGKGKRSLENHKSRAKRARSFANERSKETGGIQSTITTKLKDAESSIHNEGVAATNDQSQAKPTTRTRSNSAGQWMRTQLDGDFSSSLATSTPPRHTTTTAIPSRGLYSQAGRLDLAAHTPTRSPLPSTTPPRRRAAAATAAPPATPPPKGPTPTPDRGNAPLHTRNWSDVVRTPRSVPRMQIARPQLQQQQQQQASSVSASAIVSVCQRGRGTAAQGTAAADDGNGNANDNEGGKWTVVEKKERTMPTTTTTTATMRGAYGLNDRYVPRYWDR